MPELQAHFKDSLQLPTKNPAVLMTVISVGNSLQRDVNFSCFVKLVNQAFKKNSLKKLIIVTTGYLQRHYFSLGLDNPLDEKEMEEKANALDQAWLKQNKVYIDQFKLPVEIKNWKEVLDLEPISEFTDCLKKFQRYYDENKSFKKIVTKHARDYVLRKITRFFQETGCQIEFDTFMRVAVDYIFEELAASFVQLKKCGADFFTYPGPMNPPARYLAKQFPSETTVTYVRYEIEPPEIKKVTTAFFQPDPVSTHYACWLLKQMNWNRTQEFQFIQGFNQLLTSINALVNQTGSISSTNKIIPRRVSL